MDNRPVHRPIDVPADRSPGKVVNQCLISFGSNLGDRDDRIASAARMVAGDARVINLAASRLFETPPIGGPGGQEPFLNAVAAFDTTASAREILSLLQGIEDRLGRQRHQRWSARSIDLDVVLHGELIGGGTGLVVPHPRYTARQFVLQPACDVAAHYRDPRFGWTLERLARHLCQGAASLALIGDDVETRAEICQRLRDDHNVLVFDEPPIETEDDSPWVASFVPELPADRSQVDASELAGLTEQADSFDSVRIPRLVARMQRTTPQTRWPAPHQMWPGGWRYPEYRLEVDDMDWAVSEMVSALQSMRCPVKPVTSGGDWAV